MQIIPAIDIIDGKCVRLTQGDYTQKTIYNENPLEVAKEFEGAGLMRLHLVDLDGGIKKEEDVQVVFSSGAALATIGSLAVKNEALFVEWLQKFGADKFLL